jgi:hypothetical protein
MEVTTSDVGIADCRLPIADLIFTVGNLQVGKGAVDRIKIR